MKTIISVFFYSQIKLCPFKINHTVNIDKANSNRNYILKYRFHPMFNFKTFTGISFTNEVIPSPTELITTEQCKYKRTLWQTGMSTLQGM